MTDILKFLQSRNSSPKLQAPAPSSEHLEAMYQAAMRASDHAWLRPWRFIEVAGDRRAAFGELLKQALVARKPDADEAARKKAAASPQRAPLMIVVVTRLQEHPKVPVLEQQLSAGCAAQGLLLAAEAQGFAGVWRTGDAAFDRKVMDGLGLADNEEIVGFLYLGTRAGPAKPLPQLSSDDFVSRW